MASERQIEANRRNARHSSGPRSKSGKKAGELERVPSRADETHLKRGVRPRGGNARPSNRGRRRGSNLTRPGTRRRRGTARTGRVRHVKAAPIERATAFGRFDVPKRFASPKDEAAWILQHFCGATLWKGPPEIRDRSLASDALAGATAYGRSRATHAPQSAQAAALRSPRRHAKRPGNSRYRAAGPQSMILFEIANDAFCKTSPISSRIYKRLCFEKSPPIAFLSERTQS